MFLLFFCCQTHTHTHLYLFFGQTFFFVACLFMINLCLIDWITNVSKAHLPLFTHKKIFRSNFFFLLLNNEQIIFTKHKQFQEYVCDEYEWVSLVLAWISCSVHVIRISFSYFLKVNSSCCTNFLKTFTHFRKSRNKKNILSTVIPWTRTQAWSNNEIINLQD